MKYEVYIGFNPDRVAEYFKGRNWPVITIPRQEITLVNVDKDASLECGDGRFDNFEKRKLHGIRILGGINAIMAILTGGDEVGLEKATELIKKFGVTPGTHSADHGGCGYADLWMAGELKSAIYPYKLHDVDRGGLRIGQWLRREMKRLGGAHIRLNGNHMEEGVRLNPFRGLTEKAEDGLRFRTDDWFMADLGVPDEVRWFKLAEVIEKLKPEAAKLEVIVP
ncbi:hypothetical protein HYU94_03350 [Candidatus Daviesbacteria bacterium]|nr:hypothetical protein [Candidatus Daviesbacteria bacterium]